MSGSNIKNKDIERRNKSFKETMIITILNVVNQTI